ncbi:OmpA family protein [Vibrio mediterranei]|uniref:OmpA family protein n=1 Tax=Vibrio mediterranei TaxID=689 RepID=UPI0038CDD63B
MHRLGGGYFFDQKSEQSWSGLIGAGISTSLNRHWDIDVGYKYVPNVAGLDGDIHSFGMGLAYNFGTTETTLFTSRAQTETGNAEKNTLEKAAVVPVVKTTEADAPDSKERAASKVGTSESLVTVPDKGLNEPREGHQKFQKSSSSHLIEFRKGSAWLTQSVNQQLSSLVEQIREEDRSPISIEIIGSASKDGSRDFNYYLSEVRATRVAEYIKNTNLSDLKTNVHWVGDCSCIFSSKQIT